MLYSYGADDGEVGEQDNDDEMEHHPDDDEVANNNHTEEFEYKSWNMEEDHQGGHEGEGDGVPQGGHEDENEDQRRPSQTYRQPAKRVLPSPPHSRSNSGTPADQRVAVRRGDELAGTDYDLLDRHHLTNRRRKFPSPTYLNSVRNDSGVKRRRTGEGVRDGDTAVAVSRTREAAPAVPRAHEAAAAVLRVREDAAAAPVPRTCGDTSLAGSHDTAIIPGQAEPRRGRYSKNPKSTVPPKPYTISFYPPLWADLLETAKAEVRLSLFHTNPFPRAQTATSSPCSKILVDIVARYEQEGKLVEPGYFQEHKKDMARLLFNDTQTFRSEIKKLASELVPIAYQLTAPDHVTSQNARIQFIKDKAASLLQESRYLKGERDHLARSSHFAHPALKSICHAAFYRNSSKSVRNFPDFQSTIPKTAVALVAAYVHSLLTVWKTHGRNQAQPLNFDTLEATYKKLLVSIERVAKHKYHGPKFEAMLAEWAESGMDGFVVRTDDVDDDNDEFGGVISDFEEKDYE